MLGVTELRANSRANFSGWDVGSMITGEPTSRRETIIRYSFL